MINTVWQGFPGFHVAFVIKRLLYFEFRVFRKKRKKKVGGAEMTQIGYFQFLGLGCDRGFLCRNMVLYVATWFSGRKGCRVATWVFLVATELFLSCFFVTTGVLLVSRQRFILCHDNVVTEGPLSRSRRPRQEAKGAIGVWMRPRNFESRQEICCVTIGFHGVVLR